MGIVAVLAFCLFAGLLFTGNLEGIGLNSPLSTVPQGDGTGDGGTVYDKYANPPGSFIVKDNAYNALDISTALTLGSNVDQYFYANRNGQWILLGPHTATTGTTIEVLSQDSGSIWVMCAPHTTSTYILDQIMTLQMNSRAKAVQFVDVTGDGVKEFMIKFDMTNVPQALATLPAVTFTGFYYYEDSASTTDGTPADIAVGTSVATSSVEWYLQISATQRALAWNKIQIKMNTTDTSVAKVSSLQVPGIGTLSESGLEYWYDSSYQYYEYKVGSNGLGDCAFMTRSSTDSGKIYLTTAIRTDLDAVTNCRITVTMTVFELSYAGATVTDADSVDLYDA